MYGQEILGSVTGYIELPTSYSDSFAAKLIDCFWCLATWIGLIITWSYMASTEYSPIWPFLWLAAIGISGFMHSITETLYNSQGE